MIEKEKEKDIIIIKNEKGKDMIKKENILKRTKQKINCDKIDRINN